MPRANKVLFVCVENAGRSQMAEAFFNKYSSGKFHAVSAGTTPAPSINPLVIQAMNEVGINLENKSPKRFSEDMIGDSIATVNMGCMDKESCPSLFVKDVLDWSIEDPQGKSFDEIRKIRNSIEIQVKKLVESLEEK